MERTGLTITFDGKGEPTETQIRAKIPKIIRTVRLLIEHSDLFTLKSIRVHSVGLGYVTLQLQLTNIVKDSEDEIVDYLINIDRDGNYPMYMGRHKYYIESYPITLRSKNSTLKHRH